MCEYSKVFPWGSVSIVRCSLHRVVVVNTLIKVFPWGSVRCSLYTRGGGVDSNKGVVFTHIC